jgi:hypothetical protein
LIWPYHPKPLPDEAFSSWLARTAYGYAPKLHSFCNGVWPGVQIWNRDIDKSCPEFLLQELAAGTGTALELARLTVLSRYEGSVFESSATNVNPAWIMRLGVWHRTRRGHGQQFCPLCLAADATPYQRICWRLGWQTACVEHGTRLLDACDRCDAPCVPHRSQLPTCHVCGRDRREASAKAADPMTVVLQVDLHRAITSGYFRPLGYDAVHPLVVFGLLRQLAKVIASGRRSAALRVAIARQSPALAQALTERVVGLDAGEDLERLRVPARHLVMALAARCLVGWPFAFVGHCGEARLSRSWALRDNSPAKLPHAYVDAVDRYLTLA